ncbi:MAG TPA: STAS domain-containing protein [Gemmatimonadaceae bacterium]|nr:STAS domain-containing protein [Gemmatimonadaceae bacterium]
MLEPTTSRLTTVLDRHHHELLAQWTTEQLRVFRRGQISESDLRAQCAELLQVLRRALGAGGAIDLESEEWASARDLLTRLSAARAQQGFAPAETATFVLSLKRPLFEALRQTSTDADTLAADIWTATEVLDRLALHTTDAYMRAREELITLQQQDMLELSTPVVKLWDGVLALPMIGTLDSSRTQVVMETLLQRIVDTGSEVAILDITGVPTVDTLTAQHLLKTVTAARLMGAECIISGIRPQIAQTIVHLGVELGDVVTKATLADAFKLALSRLGLGVGRIRAGATPAPVAPALGVE